MKIIAKIFLWILTAFFAVVALASLPNVSAFLGLATIAFLMPIERWQTVLKSLVTGKIKSIIAIILAVATIFTLPAENTTKSTNSQITDNVSAVSTTVSLNENTSSFAEAETMLTTQLVTENKDALTTATVTSTTTKKITTTTTKIVTTTTTKIVTTTKTTTTEQKVQYVLNTESKKFHYLSCKNLPTKNREDVTMSRDEIIGMGYSPCGICNP